MVPSISYETKLREFERSLTEFERRQLPFATAKALTFTARDTVKPAIERRIEAAFDNPIPFTKRGVGWKAARKTMLVSSVHIKPIQAAYLKLQQTGGVRRPKRRSLVIPAGQRVNRYGNLPRGKVKALIADPRNFVGRIGSTAGIWKRRKRGAPKLLILFADSARYQPRFAFYVAARRAARRGFPMHFRRTFPEAIRTARSK